MSHAYEKPNYKQFVEDMGRAGYRVFHYGGRWSWEGPAVCTSREDGITEQDIYAATRVALQRDNMGLDLVLYPVG